MPDKVNIEQRYELAVVLRPELEADLTPVSEKIKKIILDAGGQIAQEATFADSRRELAYKIKGETHGLYGYYGLQLPADAPNKITAVLNITDEVLRHLLTKIDEKIESYLVDEAERRSEQEKKKAAETSDDE